MILFDYIKNGTRALRALELSGRTRALRALELSGRTRALRALELSGRTRALRALELRGEIRLPFPQRDPLPHPAQESLGEICLPTVG